MSLPPIQTRLPFPSSASPGARLRPSSPPGAPRGFSFSYWAPVWIPLLLLAQICLLGLGPALSERRRLDAAEERLVERYERELDRAVELERKQRALADPIYLERERRLLRAGLLRGE